MILLLIIETMVITKLYIILIFAHTGMVMKKGILWACKNCNHWNLLLIWAYWIYEHWAWISMLPLYRRYDIASFYSHCSYRNHILLLGFGNIAPSSENSEINISEIFWPIFINIRIHLRFSQTLSISLCPAISSPAVGASSETMFRPSRGSPACTKNWNYLSHQQK